jgi:hypothetical protein
VCKVIYVLYKILAARKEIFGENRKGQEVGFKGDPVVYPFQKRANEVIFLKMIEYERLKHTWLLFLAVNERSLVIDTHLQTCRQVVKADSKQKFRFPSAELEAVSSTTKEDATEKFQIFLRLETPPLICNVACGVGKGKNLREILGGPGALAGQFIKNENQKFAARVLYSPMNSSCLSL